jgi:hypothetical protein
MRPLGAQQSLFADPRCRGGRAVTKVWVVSGLVLVGTGLALAGFGAWLSGNANCDAGDLGRSCTAASLGVSVVGAALSLGGWMRVRRMQGGAGQQEGLSGRLFEERPGLVVIAFSLVGLVLLAALLPTPQPPVTLFAGGAPPLGAPPEGFLTASLGGHARTDLTRVEGDLQVTAEAGYDGGVFVRATRFNATANWTYYPQCVGPPGTCPFVPPEMRQNASVSNATADADLYLTAQYSSLNATGGPRTCVREGARLWFVGDAPGRSVLAWRDGTFVFEVIAQDAGARNAVAAALGAAS